MPVNMIQVRWKGCLFIFDVTKDETIKKEIISGKIVFVFCIFCLLTPLKKLESNLTSSSKLP